MPAPDAIPEGRPSEGQRTPLAGRYAVYGEIGSGGMATIEYGRLNGPHGFARPVAIKRLHSHFAKDPDFVSMFLDEARLSSRVHHANVIPTLDVIESPGEIALVMEYVHGEALSVLLRLARARKERVPVKVATTLIAGVLHGLHAAHEAKNDDGQPLQLVHRDVSPHNVLVGTDGVPRVLDFGIAKAIGRMRSTPSGEIKGKLAYMAPEQLRGREIDRRADVYGASAMLWEALAARRLFDGPNEAALVHAVLESEVSGPSAHNTDVPPELDAIVLKGLARDPAERYASARDMALEIERGFGIVTQSEVSDWLQHLAGERLSSRARALQAMREQATEQEQVSGSQPAVGVLATRRLNLLTDSSEPKPPSMSERLAQELSIVRRRFKLPKGYVLLAVSIITFLAVLWSALVERAQPPAAVSKIDDPPSVEVSMPAPPPVQPLPAANEIDLAPVRTSGELAPISAPPIVEKEEPAPAHKPRTRTRSTAGSATSVRKPAARNCDPAYVVDRMGVRRWKPECL